MVAGIGAADVALAGQALSPSSPPKIVSYVCHLNLFGLLYLM